MSDKIRAMVYVFFRRKNKSVNVAQFSSGKELLEYGKAIDILFLDIQMDGIDGMETRKYGFAACCFLLLYSVQVFPVCWNNKKTVCTYGFNTIFNGIFNG